MFEIGAEDDLLSILPSVIEGCGGDCGGEYGKERDGEDFDHGDSSIALCARDRWQERID